ncbi:MAG: AraC family transcriptional regulator [Lachnospiraceae bacterium]|nr:AraC family transcriptional regulator [Lachnospiraceae bacterium]
MNKDSNSNFYTKRTQRLLFSGYPLEVSKVECRPDDIQSVHRHDEIEFLYHIKGEACITCRQKKIPIREGDILFINQLAEHSIASVGSRTAESHSIRIHPTFILGYDQSDFLLNKYLTPVTSNSTFSCLHIPSSHHLYQPFSQLLKQLIQLNSGQSCGYELLSKACILQLWKLVYEQLPDSAAASARAALHNTGQDAHRVKQAVLYIQEHFMEPLTLDKIADSILVSKSECCRCFKRAIGLTPIEYLMKYRIMESAVRMKQKESESISEIAGTVGFNNTSYYSKVFKKMMGCTPSEYRQSLLSPSTRPQ